MDTMKSMIIGLGVVSGLVLVFAALPVHAQTSDLMTDDHIARIKSNCPGALSTLARIRVNEAPIFINRNQTYFSISDKLMARLNSRLALNRYDTTQLVKTSTMYNAQLAKLRVVYKEYDDAMAELLRINCRLQPVGFYDKVAEARTLREKVHTLISDLGQTIAEYKQEVSDLKAQYFSGGKS